VDRQVAQEATGSIQGIGVEWRKRKPTVVSVHDTDEGVQRSHESVVVAVGDD
jgi:hypothetical protein